MAARTGKGCSPVARVRIPAETMEVLQVVARVQQTTVSALCRKTICAVYDGLLTDVLLLRDFNRRVEEITSDEEVDR